MSKCAGWEEVALKFERRESRGGKHSAKLPKESQRMRQLAGGVGMPSVRSFTVEGDYRVMVMGLLGASLDGLIHQRGNFSHKTLLMIADQARIPARAPASFSMLHIRPHGPPPSHAPARRRCSGSSTCTRRASSTATSSPPTSSPAARTRAPSTSSTSGSPPRE